MRRGRVALSQDGFRRLTLAHRMLRELQVSGGTPVALLSGMSTSSFASAPVSLLEEARATWRHRAHTEHRSAQIFARFVTEVLAADDDDFVHAMAIDMLKEELEHARLCESVCQLLGIEARQIKRADLRDPSQFTSAPAKERALHTAITMLLVNETISVGFIEDLHARCTNPPIQRVLAATLGDETQHETFGFEYVARGLSHYGENARNDFRHLVSLTLRPHEENAERILAKVPLDKQTLDAWPDTDRVKFGLLSQERQALLYRRTLHTKLLPALQKLGLAPEALLARAS